MTIFEELREIADEVIRLGINIGETFVTLGDYTFYNDGDYVSISSSEESTRSGKLSIHSDCITPQMYVVNHGIYDTREEARAHLDKLWDELDAWVEHIPAIREELSKVAKEFDAKEAAIKAKKIAKLEAELKDLKGE